MTSSAEQGGKRVAAIESEREALFRAAGEEVPMLAMDGIDLAELPGSRGRATARQTWSASS